MFYVFNKVKMELPNQTKVYIEKISNIIKRNGLGLENVIERLYSEETKLPFYPFYKCSVNGYSSSDTDEDQEEEEEDVVFDNDMDQVCILMGNEIMSAIQIKLHFVNNYLEMIENYEKDLVERKEDGIPVIKYHSIGPGDGSHGYIAINIKEILAKLLKGGYIKKVKCKLFEERKMALGLKNNLKRCKDNFLHSIMTSYEVETISDVLKEIERDKTLTYFSNLNV